MQSLEVIITDDGSPTLSIGHGEKMHSLSGAFSENLFIYGPCVETMISLPTPRILSMGLGLGYNELISLGFLLKTNKTGFSLVSFENFSYLSQCFVNWLRNENSSINQCYDQILKRVSEHFNEDSKNIKRFCLESFNRGTFQILGGLIKKNPFDFQFHSVLYDAFSNQSNPELWTEKHLRDFIKSYCNPRHCCFSTYAATSTLKKSLRSEGFQLFKKRGFGRKRESTFALKKLQTFSQATKDL